MITCKIQFLQLLLLPLISFAQEGLQFEKLSPDEAMVRAKKENKVVFLMCYSPDCEHCTRFRTTVLTDTGVIKLFNNQFICIRQDMNLDTTHDVTMRFHIISYPTLIFIDGDGTVLYQVVGDFTAQSLIQHARNALTPEKQLPTLKKKFEADVSNPENCFSYLSALRWAALEYDDVVKKYLATKKESELITEVNWNILSYSAPTISSYSYMFIAHHWNEYAKVVSPSTMSQRMANITSQSLNSTIGNADSAFYTEQRSVAASVHDYKVDSVLFITDLEFYTLLMNWKDYQELTLRSVKKYAWNNFQVLLQIASNYITSVKDTSALNEAITWVNRSLELKESAYGYIAAAQLYSKTGNKKAALTTAKQAKDFELKNGMDTQDTDILLNELKK